MDDHRPGSARALQWPKGDRAPGYGPDGSDRPVDHEIVGDDRSGVSAGFVVDWQMSGWAQGSVVDAPGREVFASLQMLGTPSRLDGPEPRLVQAEYPVAPVPPEQPRHLAVRVIDLAVPDETHQLDLRHRLELPDAWSQENLGRLIRLACALLDAPIGLVTLADRDRHHFLATHGLSDGLVSPRNSSLGFSLGRYPVGSDRPLIVGDARGDAVLAANPALAELGVLAYAGIPLIGPTSRSFGTFCVIDLEVRDWDDHQLATLARLADIATEICLGDRAYHESEGVRRVASTAP